MGVRGRVMTLEALALYTDAARVDVLAKMPRYAVYLYGSR